MTQVVADIRAELEDTRGNVVFEDLRPAEEQAASPEAVPPDVVELPEAVVEAPVARSRQGSGQEPDAERTPSVTSLIEAPNIDGAQVEAPEEQQQEEDPSQVAQEELLFGDPEPPAGTIALVNKAGKQSGRISYLPTETIGRVMSRMVQ